MTTKAKAKLAKPAMTKMQMKILGILVICAVAVGVFFKVIYQPLQAKGKTLKTQVAQIEREIEGVYRLVGGKEKLEEGMVRLNDQLKTLEAKLPTAEQFSKLLEDLSVEAERYGIVVNAVSPMPQTPVEVQPKQPAIVEGLVCQRQPIRLSLQATYQALGEYLASLKNKPFLMGIDTVAMQYNTRRPGWLDATVIISTYALTPPRPSAASPTT